MFGYIKNLFFCYIFNTKGSAITEYVVLLAFVVAIGLFLMYGDIYSDMPESPLFMKVWGSLFNMEFRFKDLFSVFN